MIWLFLYGLGALIVWSTVGYGGFRLWLKDQQETWFLNRTGPLETCWNRLITLLLGPAVWAIVTYVYWDMERKRALYGRSENSKPPANHY